MQIHAKAISVLTTTIFDMLRIQIRAENTPSPESEKQKAIPNKEANKRPKGEPKAEQKSANRSPAKAAAPKEKTTTLSGQLKRLKKELYIYINKNSMAKKKEWQKHAERGRDN